MSFTILPNHAINKAKWDNCVQTATGLIYSRSFYLNAMAKNWSAIVGRNYDWVLPLISNKKFGISYLYQPPFTQQSGVIAKDGTNVPFNEILNWLKANYSFWDISWNAYTSGHLKDENIEAEKATDFLLNLSVSYEKLSANYHNDLEKNLKRSRQFHLNYHPSDDYNKAIDLYIQYYADRTPGVNKEDYNNFRRLCHFAKQNNMLLCRNAVNETDGIVATALLLFDGRRLYNMMNTTTNKGRKMSANHFLLDSIIREFSGRDIAFDFEGSDLPGVKTFYENFGAVNEPYFHIKYNNLPWPARLFKK